jgi:hypothetical protein
MRVSMLSRYRLGLSQLSARHYARHRLDTAIAKLHFETPDPKETSILIAITTDIDFKSIWDALLTTSSPDLNTVFKDILNMCEKNNKMQEALDLWQQSSRDFVDSFAFAKLCFFCAKVSDIGTADLLFELLKEQRIRSIVRRILMKIITYI